MQKSGSDSELQAQARRILDAIAFTPFEQCQPLSREFTGIPALDMAIASYLDSEALGFADCKPGRGQ